MNQLPMNPLSPEDQQRLASQMYILLGKQVKSYHKHRHMGENSSVPVELALELMESIDYTLSLSGGIYANADIEEALKAGQDILDTRVQRAKSMLQLVVATAPQWQTDCRWEALRCIEGYLAAYDRLHLAHRIPEELFYLVPVSAPDGIRGIDYCLFYLNIMWLENQIMGAADDTAQELLWNHLPQDTLNQCEQLLTNGIGKAILAPCQNGLVFSNDECAALCSMLRGKTTTEIQRELEEATVRLSEWLDLTDENAITYMRSVIGQLQPRLEGALSHGCVSGIFV